MDSAIQAPVISVGDEKDNRIKDFKKIVKIGQGWKTPDVGDEVEVHYMTGILGAKEYCDSSRNEGTPLKFILGRGGIIRGCNVGIQTMKKGERAVFTIPPKFGYDESGSPPVPPNATLEVDIELLSWVSSRDICKDGGIIKNIIEKGKNWENPKDLDEVLVIFQARLGDGTFVGGTSDGVEFTVNEGYFCPALSRAVETMRKGEKAFLIVKPEYGFGWNGKPSSSDHLGDVPSNATLHVFLELVSWRTVSVLTDDYKIVKKIMNAGEGSERPNDGAIVKVKLIGQLEDSTAFVMKGYDDGDELYEFKIDDEQVIEGLDIAAVTMKKSEVALLKIEPEYAFGSSESKQELATVPANSIVYYAIEMVSFVKEKEFEDMNSEEKIAAADKKKEQGDVIFKAGQYAKASRKYQRAAMYIEDDSAFTDEEKQWSKALQITCNMKDAACKLELKEYKQAETLCTKALELDSQNVKALCRRAQAYENLMDYDMAKSDLKKALKIDPQNSLVKIEYNKLKEKALEHKKKSLTKLFSNLHLLTDSAVNL